MNIIQQLIHYLNAAYPCLLVKTTEEIRAQADIIAATQKTKRPKNLVFWSATSGLEKIEFCDEGFSKNRIDDSEDLLSALRYILDNPEEHHVYVLRDAHHWPFERDPILARAFREVLMQAPEYGSCIILLSPEFKFYSTVEKLVTVIDYSLPTENDLALISKNIADSAGKKIKAGNDVIKALSGLSTTEAENALALSLAETEGKSFSPEIIYREKVAAVKRSGLLEIVNPDPKGLDAIGGLENLKDWILKRKKAYSPEAEKYGLPSPKGVLLVGVPGSGKSLSAKAFGTALGIPTLKLDIGSLFGSLVGESESRTREALALAEAISPVVLWIDEVDKGLSGSQSSGVHDGGTARKVFGTILEWMQEKKKPVFVVATANQVDSLPPEFLRRGRFDEIFALDLPTDLERSQIINVLLHKFSRKPENFDISAICKCTQNFTGAEIESTLTEAMFAAFDQDTEVTTEHIIDASKLVVPLHKMAAEQIDSIRKWGEGRARAASVKNEVVVKQTTKRKF